jgi:hypothetical protein
MGKASELDDQLEQNPLSAEDEARFRPHRPELRLRSDAPSLDVDGHIGTQLARELSRSGVHGLTLRDPQGDVRAVAIPVERYLELVGADISADENKQTAFLDGRIGPPDEILRTAHVEQVDPRDTWLQTDYDPTRPAE